MTKADADDRLLCSCVYLADKVDQLQNPRVIVESSELCKGQLAQLRNK